MARALACISAGRIQIIVAFVIVSLVALILKPDATKPASFSVRIKDSDSSPDTPSTESAIVKPRAEKIEVKQDALAQIKSDLAPFPSAESHFQDNVVIVQGRNLPAISSEVVATSGSSQSGATWLRNGAWNSIYAKRHRYAYLFYLFETDFKRACYKTAADIWVRAQWCKVLAVLHAMVEFPQREFFLWLDSDVWLQRLDMGLNTFAEKAKLASMASCVPNRTMAGSRKAFYVWMNAPKYNPRHKCLPQTGAFLVRRSEVAESILLDWWSLAGFKFSHTLQMLGPCDQGPFVGLSWKNHEEYLAKILDDSYRFDTQRFMVHRCKACSFIEVDMRYILDKLMTKYDITEEMMVSSASNIDTRRLPHDGAVLQELMEHSSFSRTEASNKWLSLLRAHSAELTFNRTKELHSHDKGMRGLGDESWQDRYCPPPGSRGIR